MLDSEKQKARYERFYSNHPKKEYYHNQYLKRREDYLNKIKTGYYKIKRQSKEKNVSNNRQYRQSISDIYCRKLLKEKGFKNDEITPDLIELKRQHIKLKRLINEKL